MKKFKSFLMLCSIIFIASCALQMVDASKEAMADSNYHTGLFLDIRLHPMLRELLGTFRRRFLWVLKK